jgi:diguanylate cyclase (GGDEF)-like protein
MITPRKNQTDDLTGLFNRKAFLEEFDDVLARSRSSHAPFSLALLDIDHFMETNDRYGHVGGDEVLVQVAKIISESVSDGEVLAGRYGGDEFVLLFLGAGREQVFLALEGMRARLEKTPFTLSSGQEVPGVPICGGLASFPIDGRARSELLRKADQALYRAKVDGRNRIRLAYEEKMVPKTTHYTQTQLERLAKLATEQGAGEAEMLREALDDLLTRYGVNDIES